MAVRRSTPARLVPPSDTLRAHDSLVRAPGTRHSAGIGRRPGQNAVTFGDKVLWRLEEHSWRQLCLSANEQQDVFVI